MPLFKLNREEFYGELKQELDGSLFRSWVKGNESIDVASNSVPLFRRTGKWMNKRGDVPYQLHFRSHVHSLGTVIDSFAPSRQYKCSLDAKRMELNLVGREMGDDPAQPRSSIDIFICRLIVVLLR